MEFYFDIKSRKYVEKENQYGFDKWRGLLFGQAK